MSPVTRLLSDVLVFLNKHIQTNKKPWASETCSVSTQKADTVSLATVVSGSLPGHSQSIHSRMETK